MGLSSCVQGTSPRYWSTRPYDRYKTREQGGLMTSSELIQIRHPEFDFSGVQVIWRPNAEVVIGFDSGSPVITPIEVFLLKVMRRAKAEMDPERDGELLRDMDLFNKQEAHHYKTHAGFNKA